MYVLDMNLLEKIIRNNIKARIFLLVDLREIFFRFRVGGTKKNK